MENHLLLFYPNKILGYCDQFPVPPVPTQTGPLKKTWPQRRVSEIQTSWLARVVRRCHNLFYFSTQAQLFLLEFTSGWVPFRSASFRIYKNGDLWSCKKSSWVPTKQFFCNEGIGLQTLTNHTPSIWILDTKQLTLRCHRPATWKIWRKGWVDWYFSSSYIYIYIYIHICTHIYI